MGLSAIATPLVCTAFKASTMAITFVGKMGVARGDIGAQLYFIFAKDYHHLQMFSCELEKVYNSRNLSFADYSCYTVSRYGVHISRVYSPYFL